jgi:hypothetical protein
MQGSIIGAAIIIALALIISNRYVAGTLAGELDR